MSLHKCGDIAAGTLVRLMLLQNSGVKRCLDFDLQGLPTFDVLRIEE